jgi:hypothetical protein
MNAVPDNLWDPPFLLSEELTIPEKVMALAKRGKRLEKAKQLVVFLHPGPVDPADFVILTIRVVVALLRPPHFIAGKDHRHTLGEQERGSEVLYLPDAQLLHRGIVRRPLDSAIPALILVVTVLVALTVPNVVLLVVRYEVGEGESIVTGNEIYAMEGGTTASAIEILTPTESGRKEAYQVRIPFPEPSHLIPVSTIPFGPAAAPRETPDLIEPRGVPRFGNQLHVFQNRIGDDLFNERRIGEDVAVYSSAEN